MLTRILLGSMIFGQAAALLAAGILTLLYSDSLMQCVIHAIGYERALGRANVLRQPDGGVLLTNPSAMARWWMAVALLGLIEITSSFTLGWLGSRHLRLR